MTMSDNNSKSYLVVLEGRHVGPYDRRTLIGMRIKKVLTNDHVLIGEQGERLSVGDLIARRGSHAPSGFALSRGHDTAGIMLRFDANFGRSGAFGFSGAGEVRLQPDVLRIAGRRRRWLLLQREARVKVPLACIQDVAVQGATLSFGLTPDAPFDAPVRQSRAGFALESGEAARELQALLPTRVSARGQEQREFAQRLAAYPHRAWATLALMALSLLAYVLLVATGAGWIELEGPRLAAAGSNFGPLTRGGDAWRLATALFLSAGLLQLAVSLYVLWDLGRLCERLLGWPQFLVVFAASGVMGELASLWRDPWVNGTGASGALFGLVGALLVYLAMPGNGVPRSTMRRPAISLGVLAGYIGLMAASGRNPDFAAYLGGFAMGAAIGLALSRPASWWPELWSLIGRVLLAIASVGVALLLWAHTPNRGPAHRADQVFSQQLGEFMSEQQRRVDQGERLAGLERSVERDRLAREQWLAGQRELQLYWQNAEDRLRRTYLPGDARMKRVYTALRDYVARQQELSTASMQAMMAGEGAGDELRRQVQERQAQVRQAAQRLRDEFQAVDPPRG